MIRLKLLLASWVVVLLAGCAHPISMTADLAQIKSSQPPSPKVVGYYIAPAERTLEVTTPGGGGDKVRYFPYRDLEASLFAALSSVFDQVLRLDAENDTTALGKDRVKLVFIPRITTTSDSPSLLTWPPTQFTIELTCRITDAKGTLVKVVTVRGRGAAEFDEFKSDFSLTSKRAATATMQKLVAALEAEPLLRD